jgi:DNA-binding response OmpR family regulator
VPPLLRLLPDGMVWLGDAPIEKSRGFSALQRRLVSYLYTHAGQRCEHDDLISYIWHGRPTPSDSDSLRKLVERTARTLEPDPSNWVYLESQKGAYCLKHTAPAN